MGKSEHFMKAVYLAGSQQKGLLYINACFLIRFFHIATRALDSSGCVGVFCMRLAKISETLPRSGHGVASANRSGVGC
jgi:hypothetical protein